MSVQGRNVVSDDLSPCCVRVRNSVRTDKNKKENEKEKKCGPESFMVRLPAIWQPCPVHHDNAHARSDIRQRLD